MELDFIKSNGGKCQEGLGEDVWRRGNHRRQDESTEDDEFSSPFQRLSLYQSCMNHMVSKSDRKPQTKGALKK